MPTNHYQNGLNLKRAMHEQGLKKQLKAARKTATQRLKRFFGTETWRKKEKTRKKRRKSKRTRKKRRK